MLAGGLIAIALIDVPYQYWRFHRELRMSREELRQEMREMEGDPQLKAQDPVAAAPGRAPANDGRGAEGHRDRHQPDALRGRARLARRADARAAVVAKGADLIAQRIREIGAEHGVPVLEAPPLARALHAHAELDAEIPQPLYAAVAQVLA